MIKSKFNAKKIDNKGKPFIIQEATLKYNTLYIIILQNHIKFKMYVCKLVSILLSQNTFFVGREIYFTL